MQEHKSASHLDRGSMILRAQELAPELPSCLVHVRDGEPLALHRAEGGTLRTPRLPKNKEMTKEKREEKSTTHRNKRTITPEIRGESGAVRLVREQAATTIYVVCKIVPGS